MTLAQTHYFCVRKALLSNYLNLSDYLISHITQLLIRKFYCFRPGPHISFKVVQHNRLRCPMMEEVPLKT